MQLNCIEVSREAVINSIIIGGDRNQYDYFKTFFSNNGIEVSLCDNIFYEPDEEDEDDAKPKSDKKQEIKQQTKDKKEFSAALIFSKNDIHLAEHHIKEIKTAFNKLPILVVTDNHNFTLIDNLYKLDVNEICFDFKPEIILAELKKIDEKVNKNKDIITDEKELIKKHYIVNFFENKNSFIVEFHGPLIKEKIAPLRLMFENELKAKLHSIKGIIYILTDIHESTLIFKNIWTLFRMWNDLRFDYKKITYLTTSEFAIKQINNYFSDYGVKHFDNLLDTTQYLYPELAKSGEDKLFDFAGQLLQAPKKVFS